MIVVVIVVAILICIITSIVFSFKTSVIIDSFYFEGHNYVKYSDGSCFRDSNDPFSSNEIIEHDFNYAKDLWKKV